MIIAIFFVSLFVLLYGIIKLKMDSGVMMLITALFTGILLGMPAKELVSTVASGFGNMMAALGIVVGLGSILGGILAESGATDQLALAMLRKFGSKKANVALNATGYLVSIPVFMGPAYIILNPICTTLAKHTKKNVIGYTTALVVGLMCTHCLVIPTPGPLAVAGSLNANVGLFILYSIIVSLPASICGGTLYGNYLTKKFSHSTEAADVTDDDAIAEITKAQKPVHPSAATAIILILLPIILILFATLLPYVTQAGFVLNICTFLSASNGVGALLLRDDFAQKLTPLIAGGTGSASDSEYLPPYLPDRFESGTANLPGCYGWEAALRFIEETGVDVLRQHERALCARFLDGLADISGVRLVGPRNMDRRVGVISVDFLRRDNAEMAYALEAQYGILTRCGLHCAPSAHKTLGTFPQGTVRFSLGWASTEADGDAALAAIRALA